jgi:hypothetical protein
MIKQNLHFKKKNLSGLATLLFALFSAFSLSAQQFTYSDSWGGQGFTLVRETPAGVVITFSINDFSLTDQVINQEEMKTIQLPGAFLQNNEGAPNLPGRGKYIALPQGATVRISSLETRTVSFPDVNISPAPRLPLVTDLPPLHFEKNINIYGKNEFYPAQPVILSEPRKVRGVDAVILGITPFQYNPVTRELTVIRDLRIEISFEGGNGIFGEERYRSRTWDPILRDLFINHASLPEADYSSRENGSRDQNWEYVIITPDNPYFYSWADSLRKWRNSQGIRTGVVKLSQIGGNTSSAIENYINNAYNNWPVAPSAFLLLADYGTSGDNTIVAPEWNNYCISDNLYADVDGDDLPDVALARITAQNADQLSTMIGKMMNYELSPPTDPDFYDHPISAGGWQSDRWFILCADICLGFWEHELNKEPVREYAGYGSGAPSYWSTNPNTDMVVNYFGPNGLEYIPQTPSHLTDWGGSASRINADLNAGAFMIIHRDHGEEMGWSSPAYYNSDLAQLDENPLSFVFSLNCLTGKFNLGGECFSEAFHRHTHGALGIIAATEVSYSFVNDAYAWGLWDHMWPGFDPAYGSPESNSHWIRPGFANASAKYYLEASNWPYNPENKPHTYYLFHHHGDAYMYVYSELPQTLMVTHENELDPGGNVFTITATQGSLIGLSINGNYLASAIATGSPQNILITPQQQGTVIKVVATKQNHERYTANVLVAGPPTPAVSPSPGNHAQGVAPFTTLHWSPGPLGYVEYYKIYLGTDDPPTNIINGTVVTDTSFTPPVHLDFETSYNWRVDSYNSFGSAQGAIWDFKIDAPPDENFETGNFSSFDWYFGGNANWQTTWSQARHGTFSARSGAISPGQSSSLLIENQSESFFMVSISFWIKTSTVEGANVLQFLIDGEVKGEWSGETDWTEGTFSFIAGEHNFEWKYIKNQEKGADEDAVWLDYIQFPPGSLPVIVHAGDDMILCEGDTPGLNGNATNYMSLFWTTSGDGSFNDPTILDPVYTPGVADIESGAVILTLTATRNLNSTSDDLALTIYRAPVVAAGGTGEICQGDAYECLSASAEHILELAWTSSGDGFFNDPGLLNPLYTPGPGDIESGQTELVLTATGYTPCKEMSDTLLLTVEPLPGICAIPSGSTEVDIYYTNTSTYTTEGAIHAHYYEWTILPPEAGSLDNDSQDCIVYWNPSFQGDALISVRGINDCGEGTESEALEVTVYNTVNVADQDEEGPVVTILPNPNEGVFTLSIFSKTILSLDVFLTSSTGKVVVSDLNLPVNGWIHKTYAFPSLEEGVYVIHIRGDEIIKTKKIVIIH